MLGAQFRSRLANLLHGYTMLALFTLLLALISLALSLSSPCVTSISPLLKRHIYGHKGKNIQIVAETAVCQELEDHTDEVNVQHEVLDGVFTFCDSTRASLNVLDGLISLFSPPSRKMKAV